MKKVITVGVFDYFHLGHLRLFEKARSQGDYLIVAVQDGESILKTKPNTKVLYSTKERIEIVKALRIVDEVIVYKDVDTILPEIEFDVFVKGPDQNHDGFKRAEKWCVDNDKKIVVLPRTPGICSSDIKEQLENME